VKPRALAVVKFDKQSRFEHDYWALPRNHREIARRVIAKVFQPAAERAAAGEPNPWPNSLRVKRVQGTSGVWEMTWSRDHPDGRATWEWIEIGGAPAVRWRRIGTHRIFAEP
jgi:hypothetical protein